MNRVTRGNHMITIIIVDEHNLVRVGIARVLSDIDTFKVVGEAKGGEEAVSLVRKLQPQVILMNVKMQGMDGIEATRKLLQINPSFNIIAVASCNNDVYVSSMIQAGAKGYITKGSSPEELIASITAVVNGKLYMSSDIASRLALQTARGQREQPLFNQLSNRELQTAMMVVKGVKTKSIADTFCVSTKTVNSYRYRIFEKLDINSDVELAILAIRYKMFDIDELMLSA